METPLTNNIRPDREPLDIEGYEQAGGYRAVRKVLGGMAPADVIEAITQSKLRGRGGAGFPTGIKWSLVPKDLAASGPHYLVVNADEMEPGTFKDRLLLEGDPHQMIEAVIVAAYAIQAETAYIFLRGEYFLAERRLRRAVGEADARGYLGTNILGSGYDLAVHVHASGGRYICGEETALLTALEGRRAVPRAKPPFPQTSGLWGKPTVVNNVETLCNVPHIINNGADWFMGLGRGEDGGTKIYGASGRVRRPGSWELPMSTPLCEIIEEHAGGMRDGYELRGVLPGGLSTSFIMADDIEVKMDFASVEKVGSRLGTGAVIVLDQRTCPIGMLRNLEHFFAQESCGWCTPCRDGLPWVERLLAGIEAGEGEMDDLDILEQHVKFLGPGRTFCAHAPGAMAPLASGLKYFRAEFEQHIHEKRCPWNEAH
ncbi:NADH-quinone oxidoreductase subunit NuoF [Acidiphilium iwatense]|uniref:NADH-quinone oxidoreductase subunit F n=1 Tax=Acidiphilium iwatense TaxID=768198 RepID=A0ABS9E0Q0_9PROT|nr:NADH-quinone oxidoreductase subunit NuoF [Acidiphilium iwatense]MCF3947144.1 NADH-quinone oxidoreductase subunit NuoF [Acidiphilium iwatense]